MGEHGTRLIVRLFETLGSSVAAIMEVPALGISVPLSFVGFEIKTLLIDPVSKEIRETSILEE